MIKVGKAFYANIFAFKISESEPKLIWSDAYAKGYAGVLTSQISKKYPDSRYAKAAARAIVDLKELGKPVLNPQDYLAMTLW